MIDSLNKGLNAIGKRRDLVVVGLLVTAIAMMVLPLPTWLVDALLAINLSAAVLLLMMGLYIKDPLEFTTLPSVILIVTIFRLALSVTTTRLILSEADAGQIIETFGNYVIAGNIVVGLVIFLIITVVQFVVITEAERVAEVSARFTLDALPGKQMSIDSDVRAGDIDAAEARRRRKTLAQESQFYGAMDGAMKFVKGDAIAGLVITAVNLIGGMAVGMLQQGMDSSEAMAVYSMLTIGDGLAAQLPALFISLAAGAIVTRVSDEDSGNLGDDITNQMFASPPTVRTAAVIIAGLGFAPGFPTPYFLLIAGLLLALSYGDWVREKIFGPEPEPESEPQASVAALSAAESPFALRVPAGALSDDDAAAFAERAAAIAADVSYDVGVTLAPVRLEQDPAQAPGSGDALLEEVPAASFAVRADRIAVDARDELAVLAQVDAEPGGAAPGMQAVWWAPLDAEDRLRADGLNPAPLLEHLLRIAEAVQRKHAADGIGAQEARVFLADLSQDHPALGAEVANLLPAAKLAEVLKRLADENAPLRHRRALGQALAEWAPKEQDPVVLTEYVRTALARQISHAVTGARETLPVYLLDKSVEDAVRGAIRQTAVGEYLALDDRVAEKLVSALRQAAKPPESGGPPPAVLTALDVRRFVRGLLKAHGMADTPVLSYQDIAPQVRATPVATIRVA